MAERSSDKVNVSPCMCTGVISNSLRQLGTLFQRETFSSCRGHTAVKGSVLMSRAFSSTMPPLHG